jgi:predicted secreted protein
MRRTATALLLAFALAAPFAAAQPPPSDPGHTVVALAESAQREVPRDRLRVTLRIEQVGGDAARVQSEINRRMAAAIEKAKAQADVGRFRVETGGYWIYQERPQDAPPRWRGAQTLVLVGTDAAALLPLAGQIQQDGFLMSGMAWELARDTARRLEDELTAEALQRLRLRAELVAREMGMTLLRFGKVAIGNVGGERPPLPAPMREAMTARTAAPVAAEPSVELVQISVQAEILLKPRP